MIQIDSMWERKSRKTTATGEFLFKGESRGNSKSFVITILELLDIKYIDSDLVSEGVEDTLRKPGLRAKYREDGSLESMGWHMAETVHGQVYECQARFPGYIEIIHSDKILLAFSQSFSGKFEVSVETNVMNHPLLMTLVGFVERGNLYENN